MNSTHTLQMLWAMLPPILMVYLIALERFMGRRMIGGPILSVRDASMAALALDVGSLAWVQGEIARNPTFLALVIALIAIHLGGFVFLRPASDKTLVLRSAITELYFALVILFTNVGTIALFLRISGGGLSGGGL